MDFYSGSGTSRIPKILGERTYLKSVHETVAVEQLEADIFQCVTF